MAASPNGVVVYESRYGATRQYAEWIKQELGIPLVSPERLDEHVLSLCDFLVVGAPVYLGKMLVADWLKDNQINLREKRLFLFIVCTHYADVEKQQTMIKENVPEGILASCETFFVPGRVVVGNLSAEDALALGLGENTDRDRASLADPCDPVHKANIIPLLDAVAGFQKVR